jgi:hypothetical protein
MTEARIKFRCYKCNQLVGVSRTRVGSVVSCPKCSAGLVVPEPSDEPPASAVEAAQGDGPTAGSAVSAPPGLEELISAIRPEDIRVEPGIPPLSRAPAAIATPAAAEETAAPPPERTIEYSLAPEPPAQTPAEDAVVPPIRLETPRIIAERVVGPRARDVVLPRSVVLAWSLFVLLALALAFTAGLLAGHFVWRVHERRPTARLDRLPPRAEVRLVVTRRAGGVSRVLEMHTGG